MSLPTSSLRIQQIVASRRVGPIHGVITQSQIINSIICHRQQLDDLIVISSLAFTNLNYHHHNSHNNHALLLLSTIITHKRLLSRWHQLSQCLYRVPSKSTRGARDVRCVRRVMLTTRRREGNSAWTKWKNCCETVFLDVLNNPKVPARCFYYLSIMAHDRRLTGSWSLLSNDGL